MPAPKTAVASRSVRIRNAGRGDTPGLLALEAECFVSDYENTRFTRAQFRYYLDNPRSIAYVAVAGGRQVGYLLGVVRTRGGRSNARLVSLAVARRARKRQVGRRLMHRFLAEVERRGPRRVFLEVATSNRPARRLFEEFGFRKLRHLPRYYTSRTDGIRMLRATGARRSAP